MKEVKNIIIGGMQEHQSIKTDGVSTCLTSSMGTGGGYVPMVVKQIGNVLPTQNRDNPNQGRVYDKDGLSPCINTMQGGNLQPMVVGGLGKKNSNNGTQYYQQDRVYSSDGVAMCHPSGIPGGSYKYLMNETIKIKQATRKGYVECEVGGVADIEGIKRIEKVGQISSDGSQYRIRKLTPKECWRLMGFTDEEFEKAAAVNSNTQLYKQAGNSIVVDVLVAIFSEMINSLEDKTPKYQHMEQMSLFDYE